MGKDHIAYLIVLALSASCYPTMAQTESQDLCEKVGRALTYGDYKPFSHGKTWHGFELFDSKTMNTDQIKTQYKASDVLSDRLDELTDFPGQTILYSSKLSALHIVSHFEGSAACRADVYFFQHGMQHSDLTDAPKLYKTRTHDICNDSATLFVSFYEKQPVMIRMEEPDEELLTTLSFARWQDNGWGHLCQIGVTRAGKGAIQVKTAMVDNVDGQ